jgi:hypothetical protein
MHFQMEQEMSYLVVRHEHARPAVLFQRLLCSQDYWSQVVTPSLFCMQHACIMDCQMVVWLVASSGGWKHVESR